MMGPEKCFFSDYRIKGSNEQVIHFPPPSFQSFPELGCVALVPVYFEEKQGDEEQAMYREGYDIRVKSHSGGCRGTGQRLEDLCKQGAEMHPNMSARSQRAFEKLNLNSVLLQNKAERAREDAKSHKPQTPQTCIRFYADVGSVVREARRFSTVVTDTLTGCLAYRESYGIFLSYALSGLTHSCNIFLKRERKSSRDAWME
ncbi:hypothetical protein MJT46_004115 [Ovis ammon polii x Ovis aries]|nr:hypothetical protein MJT46_004115 [Ovis ammon polii x Ovis aries]